MEDRDLESLQRDNKHLRERLQTTQQRADRLLAEAQRWRKAAEKERASWMKTHSALNLVVADAQRVMAENGVEGVYARLGEEREENAKLRTKVAQGRKLRREVVEALSVARQETRDRDAVIEEMRQRLVETERQRDAAVLRAEEILNERDAKLTRYRHWCERWYKGEVDAMLVISGITADLNGNTMPPVTELERRRAVAEAETISLMNEATDQLQNIEALLEGEGVSLVNTHVKQVKDYIELMKGRVEAAEDRGR